jgi:NADH-quinone oxidoreductase subunit C
MSAVLEKIKNRFGEGVLGTHSDFGDDTAVVRREILADLAKYLKGDPELAFNVLMDLTAVDGLRMGKQPRFEVVYHFYSLTKNGRVRIKVPVGEEDPKVATLTGLWPIADWFEREVWDMFGIRFEGHPHLKRILMYEGFTGHPLRKDYPVNKRQPLIGPKN